MGGLHYKIFNHILSYTYSVTLRLPKGRHGGVAITARHAGGSVHGSLYEADYYRENGGSGEFDRTGCLHDDSGIAVYPTDPSEYYRHAVLKDAAGNVAFEVTEAKPAVTPRLAMAARSSQCYISDIYAYSENDVKGETQPPEEDSEPAETETPDTEAPDTEAPETEAPDTEAPDTEAPDTAPPRQLPQKPSPPRG